MSKITMLVFTDGRTEFLQRTMDSMKNLWLPIKSSLQTVIINDSSDYRDWLEKEYPSATVHHNEPKLGFTGTIANAWGHLVPRDTEYVFHLEDDFVLKRQVHLADMISILQKRPLTMQVALKRGPVNNEELAAGDLVGLRENATEHRSSGLTWIEHRLNFTTNPSLYRRSLCDKGWPSEKDSERVFSDQLMKDPHVQFAYLGGLTDAPLVEHIGSFRVGHGY